MYLCYYWNFVLSAVIFINADAEYSGNLNGGESMKRILICLMILSGNTIGLYRIPSLLAIIYEYGLRNRDVEIYSKFYQYPEPYCALVSGALYAASWIYVFLATIELAF